MTMATVTLREKSKEGILEGSKFPKRLQAFQDCLTGQTRKDFNTLISKVHPNQSVLSYIKENVDLPYCDKHDCYIQLCLNCRKTDCPHEGFTTITGGFKQCCMPMSQVIATAYKGKIKHQLKAGIKSTCEKLGI